jgi:hypothetical protein
MAESDYIFFGTYFDSDQVRTLVNIFKQEGIDFKIENKSGPINYRVPTSTYIEVDVMVVEADYEKAGDLLKEFEI